MKAVLLACMAFAAIFFSSHAKAGCGGNLIEVKNAYHDGVKVGELALYYNPDNGNNCAIMSHAGPSWGVPIATLAEVGVCQDSACFSRYVVQDYGTYSYYAGPVRVYGKGRCVVAKGDIQYKGYAHLLETGKHCR